MAALGIAATIVVSRAPVLLQSVASADEGLYALVARELLRGHLPYTTVWETKPPLLFALLAAAFAIFGTSVLSLRLATDIAILATALALYAIGSTLGRDGRTVGLAAALLYAALTLSDGASSALAETFYAPFVAIPLAVTLGRGNALARPALRSATLGASLGCALLVKESAALEAAFAGFVIVRARGVRALLPLLAGFVAALVLSALPFAAGHALGPYWDANYTAVARRAVVPVMDATPFADVVRAQALAFFPVTLLAFGLPWFLRRDVSRDDERRLALVIVAWAAVDLATVGIIHEFLGNHFIPLMAPAALLGAVVIVAVARSARSSAILPAVLALALLGHCAYQFVLAAPIAFGRIARHDPAYGDTTAKLAAYINANAVAGDTLYVADDRTMLYVLTGFAPPTRYAYAAHLIDPYQEIISGVDGPAEVARILGRHPTFVVRDLDHRTFEDARARELLDRGLAGAYRAAFAVGAHTIYAYSGKS